MLPALYRGMKIWKIAQADAAGFLLRKAKNPTLLHQRPVLTSG